MMAENAMKTTGCNPFVFFILLVRSHKRTASTQPIQLIPFKAKPFAKASGKRRADCTTLMPAAAMRPAEAGRSP